MYYIRYVMIKEYVKVYSANPLYLIFRCVNGYTLKKLIEIDI